MVVDARYIAVVAEASWIGSLDWAVDLVHLDVLVVHSLVDASLSDVAKAWHLAVVDSSYEAMGPLANVMVQLAHLEVVIPIAVVDTFAEAVSEQVKRQVEIDCRTSVLELVPAPEPELALGQQLAVEP